VETTNGVFVDGVSMTTPHRLPKVSRVVGVNYSGVCRTGSRIVTLTRPDLDIFDPVIRDPTRGFKALIYNYLEDLIELGSIWSDTLTFDPTRLKSLTLLTSDTVTQ